MATYCNTTSGYCYTLTPVQFVNETTYEWRVNTLPTNLTVINGTLSNGTIINGKVYNGTEVNGTVIIERLQPSAIGSLSVVSFIYMIMTFLVIIIMALPVIKWIEAAVKQRLFTEKQFKNQLQRYYPPPGIKLLRSYAETVSRHPNADCTSEGLWEFRELIREKYAMDVLIWTARFVGEKDLPLVEDRRRRSRGATHDMLKFVGRWVKARDQWSEEEWAKVNEIYVRIRGLNEAEQARYQAPG